MRRSAEDVRDQQIARFGARSPRHFPRPSDPPAPSLLASCPCLARAARENRAKKSRDHHGARAEPAAKSGTRWDAGGRPWDASGRRGTPLNTDTKTGARAGAAAVSTVHSPQSTVHVRPCTPTRTRNAYLASLDTARRTSSSGPRLVQPGVPHLWMPRVSAGCVPCSRCCSHSAAYRPESDVSAPIAPRTPRTPRPEAPDAGGMDQVRAHA